MRNIIMYRVLFVFVMYLTCGFTFAQSKMSQQEKYIDAKMAKYKNNPAYSHMSLFGCNLSNTYNFFCENLKKKGFVLKKKDESVAEQMQSEWRGKLSNKETILYIDHCGKYIIRIWTQIICKDDKDQIDTYKNVGKSLVNKYGKVSYQDKVNVRWYKKNMNIEFYMVGKRVCVKYDDMIYQNWIKEYKENVSNRQNKKDRRAFDENL